MMLFKNKSTNNKKYLYLSVLPLVGIVVFSTLVFNTSKAKAIVREVESGIEEIKLSLVNQQEDVSPNVSINENVTDELLIKVKVLADTVAVPTDSREFVEWFKSKLKENNILERYYNKGIVMNLAINSSGVIDDFTIIDMKTNDRLIEIEELFKDIPKWEPAIKNGKPISSRTTFILGFSEKDGFSSNSERVILSQEEKSRVREEVMSGEIVNKEQAGDELFTQAEINPEPPGGMREFRIWIGDNYRYPQKAIDAGLKGTLKISFIVEKDGSLSDFIIEKNLGYGTGEAAIEMLKKSPKWSPAIQRGKPVRVQYILPIRLDLTSEELQEKEVSSVEYEQRY